jgi:hypothetical protein
LQKFSNHIFNKQAAQADPNGVTTADIIDYIVVERHLAAPNGKWRVAGKIVPQALPSAESLPSPSQKPPVDGQAKK